MKISEVVGNDAEKVTADNLKQAAKRMSQQASAAQARLKVKKAQQQLAAAIKPTSTLRAFRDALGGRLWHHWSKSFQSNNVGRSHFWAPFGSVYYFRGISCV